MPRQARLDAPGLLHHIITRGIERRNIFLEKEDYQDFLTRLEKSLHKEPNQILAWALMSNHFHLLVRSGKRGIASLMRRLMTGYAMSFNFRHKRTGILFQNRYKSIVCEEDPYLLELVRYIHLNPLRAGIVKSIKELGDYPYTGHSVLMGRICRGWQETQEVLDYFGSSEVESQEGYDKFIEQGKNMGKRHDLVGGGLIRSQGGMGEVLKMRREEDRQLSDARVLGSGDFVEGLMNKIEVEDIRSVEWKRRGIDLRWVIKELVMEKELSEEEIFKKGRRQAVSEVKAMVIYAGEEYFGKRVEEMSRITRMTNSGATQAKNRGYKLFHKSKLSKKLQLTY